MGAKRNLKKLLLRFVYVSLYCLLGAAVFYAIEHTDGYSYSEEVKRKDVLYNKTKHDLMRRFGINETEFALLVTKISDARSYTPFEWSFTRGIELSWQAMTTIGYGNKTPTTLGGQLFLIPFALFGIPLTILMLNTVGENICQFVCFVETKIEKKILKRKEVKNHELKCLIAVNILAVSLLVFMASISTVTENWSFGQGLYVWFVTFSTVGFGDYIPGANGSDKVEPAAVVYRVILVIIGLSLISTIFNAMGDCYKLKHNPMISKLRRVFNLLTCSQSEVYEDNVKQGVELDQK